MKNYEHSESFSRLKNITERLSKNLTTLEYLHTLDMFLWRAIEPIQKDCPSLFNNYVAKIVAKQTRKASTRFTSDDRTKLPIHLFNLVTTRDPAKATEFAKSMYINRGLLFGFINMFFRRMQRYETLHTSFDIDPAVRTAEISEIEKQLGARQGAALYSTIREARFWYDKARDFKDMILEKYARMTLMHAKSAYEDYNHYVPFNDVIQIYLSVVSKAIDRCDARQGVLTTFITNWFKSGKSAVGELAKTQHDQSYESLVEDLGDAASEVVGSFTPETDSELQEHLAFIAKAVDRQGYFRAALHIPEYLSKEQRAVLELYALE